MPQLGDVLTTFINHFSYLDKQSHRRQAKYYEFWYKNDYLKNTFTNVALTQAIEEIVKRNTSALEQLKRTDGRNDFQLFQSDFCERLEDIVHQVRIERFKHGTIKTTRYQDGSTSTLERHIYSKKPNYLEESLIAALKAVRDQFPELDELISPMFSTMNQSALAPVLVFKEEVRGNGCSKSASEYFSTPMGAEYQDIDARAHYGKTGLPRLSFTADHTECNRANRCN